MLKNFSLFLTILFVLSCANNVASKKSHRLNLLSQAVSAKKLSGSSNVLGLQQNNDQFSTSTGDKFVPIPRMSTSSMMANSQPLFNGQQVPQQIRFGQSQPTSPQQGFVQQTQAPVASFNNPSQQFISNVPSQQTAPIVSQTFQNNQLGPLITDRPQTIQQQQQTQQIQRPVQPQQTVMQPQQTFVQQPQQQQQQTFVQQPQQQQQQTFVQQPQQQQQTFVQQPEQQQQTFVQQPQQPQQTFVQQQQQPTQTFMQSPQRTVQQPIQQTVQPVVQQTLPKTGQINNQMMQPQVDNMGFTADPCRNSQPGDLIPHPVSVTQFIICYGFGEFTIMECPEHLFYNPHLERCDIDTAPPPGCASNPCLNNGKCTDLPKFQYKCDCAPGFTGQNCEKSDSCLSRPCGDSGTCMPMPSGSPVAHTCLCNGARAIGTTCFQNAVETNPCLQPNSNFRHFPLQMNPSIFVQCEGIKPHFKFCLPPLVFSMAKQTCDWQAK